MSGLVAGAVMMTFFAPAARCLAASSRLVNLPVDSKTMSTPRSFHGNSAGSFTERTLNSSPIDGDDVAARASIVAERLPSTESYFSRCASVLASVMSFTATKSMAASPRAARMMLRPMRPNPLMPTLIDMYQSSGETTHFICARLAAGSMQSDILGHCKSFHVYRLQRSRAGGPCRGPSPWFLYQAIRYRKYVGSLSAAHGLSARLVQRRRRTVDLDPCGVGGRGADGAAAGPGSARALSVAAHLFVDDDDGGAGCRAAECAGRRRGVLLPVRPAAVRAADTRPRSSQAVSDDGNRNLAESPARVPRARRQDRDRQRPSLAAFVPSLPARSWLHEDACWTMWTGSVCRARNRRGGSSILAPTPDV